jgi:hypothetical protein
MAIRPFKQASLTDRKSKPVINQHRTFLKTGRRCLIRMCDSELSNIKKAHSFQIKLMKDISTTQVIIADVYLKTVIEN